MYIGQQPSTTFDSGIQDRFTGLTTSYVTLTHDISAETDILVVWNNIVQDSGTYSVGGTGNRTLTLGGTLVSGDVVTVYYTNKVMQSVNPTAGSVNTTQLADLGVTGAKLNTDVISAQTALGATPADTDELLVSDAGVLKRVDYSHLKSSAGSIYFLARRGNSGQTVANDTYVTIQMDTEMEDSGSVFNPSTYKFTPAVVGKYFVFAQVCFSVNAGTDWDAGTLLLDKNDAGYTDTNLKNSMSYIDRRSGGDSVSSFYASQIFDMDADDTIRVQFQGTWSGASSNQTVGYGKTYFGGFQIA